MKLFPKGMAPRPYRFMTEESRDAFLEMVRNELQRREVDFTFSADLGGFSTGEQELGLINLAQGCQQLPRDEWQADIVDFLDVLLKLDPSSATITFDEVRNHLKLRLVPRDMMLVDGMATWPVSEEFVTYLAIDYPRVVKSASSEQLESWKITKEEAWNIALDNVRQQDPVEIELMPVGPDAITVLNGDSVFTTGHLFMLEKHFPTLPAAGMLVAVPHRHMILCRELDSPQSVNQLSFLKYLAERAYCDGPGSISPEVFWWQPSRLEKLDVKLTEEGAAFRPSEAFKGLWG